MADPVQDKTQQDLKDPPAGDPPAAKPPAADPPAAKPPAAAKALRDDDASSSKDPAPDADGMYHLSKSNFAKRIARMAGKELKKIFGTSDVDQILSDRKEHEELKKEKAERDAKEEKARRAAMKEEERLKEDNAKLSRRATELEAALSAKDEERLIDKQEHYLQGVAGKVVDDESVEYALSRFRRHIRSLSNDKVEAMDEKAVAGWFDEWAKSHPKHAREGAAPPPKVELKKVPLSSAKPVTSRPGDKAQGTGTAGKKPIDMTPAEFKQYLRDTGRSHY